MSYYFIQTIDYMQSTESIKNLILRVFYVYEKTLIFRLKIILQS